MASHNALASRLRDALTEIVALDVADLVTWAACWDAARTADRGHAMAVRLTRDADEMAYATALFVDGLPLDELAATLRTVFEAGRDLAVAFEADGYVRHDRIVGFARLVAGVQPRLVDVLADVRPFAGQLARV